MPCNEIPAIEAYSSLYPCSQTAFDTEIWFFLFNELDLFKESTSVKQGSQIVIPMTEIQEFKGAFIEGKYTILAIMAGKPAKNSYGSAVTFHYQVSVSGTL
jgi:hypothetical protein